MEKLRFGFLPCIQSTTSTTRSRDVRFQVSIGAKRAGGDSPTGEAGEREHQRLVVVHRVEQGCWPDRACHDPMTKHGVGRASAGSCSGRVTSTGPDGTMPRSPEVRNGRVPGAPPRPFTGVHTSPRRRWRPSASGSSSRVKSPGRAEPRSQAADSLSPHTASIRGTLNQGRGVTDDGWRARC